jgi:hypothetical protein
MDKHENAIGYIVRLIKSLDPSAVVEVIEPKPYQYGFHIDIKGQYLRIIFGRSTMDDFENSIVTEKGSDRYRAVEGFVKYQIYIELGKMGLIPDFDISAEILNEKRDWLQQYNVRFEKSTWLYEIFYHGLKELHSFLGGLTKQYKTLPEEIVAEQGDIAHLIEYYDKNHNFNDSGVSVSSLGYFKAAAVCVLLNKEKDRRLTKIPRILKAIDEEIYKIVFEIREGPFPQIKMPACIYDYVEHLKSERTTSAPTKDLVFIACGQSTSREKNLGTEVSALLRRYNIPSFLAETANDLESLNSHIFKNLSDCTGFIAILHRRPEGRYDTSVWINQEVAIAAYLRSLGKTIPSLVLYEEGTAVEGLIRYTIANPPTFKSDEEALSKIEEWIKHQDFKYVEKMPEFDLMIDGERKHFGASSGGGSVGYHDIKYALSFRIRNKSDVNICLENVEMEAELLGKGTLDKTNPRLSRLPFNVGPRVTEELNICLKFQNGLELNMKGKDIKLCVRFEFADRVITKDVIGYIS